MSNIAEIEREIKELQEKLKNKHSELVHARLLQPLTDPEKIKNALLKEVDLHLSSLSEKTRELTIQKCGSLEAYRQQFVERKFKEREQDALRVQYLDEGKAVALVAGTDPLDLITWELLVADNVAELKAVAVERGFTLEEGQIKQKPVN